MKKRFTQLFKLWVLTVALSLPYLTSFGQWEVLTSNTFSNVSLDDIYVSVTGDTIVAVGTDVNDSFTGYILTSFDAGDTWQSDNAEPGYLFKGISFSDSNIGSIAVLGSVGCTLRSTNGGADWNWHWCDEEYSGVYDITFTDSQVGYLAGYGYQQFGDGTIFKTTDAGNTWQNISGALPNMPFEFIQKADDNVFYGGSFLFFNRSLQRSTDSGVSWEPLDVDDIGSRDVYFHDAAHGILLGEEAIYQTSDSANSWTEVGTFPEISNPVFASVVFKDELHGFAFVNGSNNAGHVVISEDGGYTWAMQDYSLPNGIVVKARAFNGRVYAVTATGKIIVSSPSSVGIESEAFSATDLVISPNPTKQTFQISYSAHEEPIDYKLFDLAGNQLTINLIYKSPGLLGLSMDEDLPEGIYCLVLSFKNGQYKTKRIIKA